MKRYFKDSYGATASIKIHRNGEATLRVHAGHDKTARKYSTYSGARAAMGRMGDCWQEVSA